MATEIINSAFKNDKKLNSYFCFNIIYDNNLLESVAANMRY